MEEKPNPAFQMCVSEIPLGRVFIIDGCHVEYISIPFLTEISDKWRCVSGEFDSFTHRIVINKEGVMLRLPNSLPVFVYDDIERFKDLAETAWAKFLDNYPILPDTWTLETFKKQMLKMPTAGKSEEQAQEHASVPVQTPEDKFYYDQLNYFNRQAERDTKWRLEVLKKKNDEMLKSYRTKSDVKMELRRVEMLDNLSYLVANVVGMRVHLSNTIEQIKKTGFTNQAVLDGESLLKMLNKFVGEHK